jgi:hypothetical protein
MLSEIADQLASGKISISAACLKAQDLTRGTPRRLPWGTGRVLQNTSEVQKELADLAAYTNRYSMEDTRRWAATLLMVHAQLGPATDIVRDEVDPEIMRQLIDPVRRLIHRVVEVSGNKSPNEANEFAAGTIDALLAFAKWLPEEEVDGFLSARARFIEGWIPRDDVIPGEETEAAMNEFINARELGKMRRILDAYPDLLSTPSLEAMSRLMEKQVLPEGKRQVAERLALLRRCKTEGLDRAFRGHFRPEFGPGDEGHTDGGD